MIENKLQLSDRDAITELYSSRLYELLEKEETKFWKYSTENEVFDYIRKFYDILHRTGEGYIIKDIDRYIES